MPDDLSPAGHPVNQRKDKTPKGLNVFFAFIIGQHGTDLFFKCLQVRPGIGDHGTIGAGDHGHIINIMFVLNIADNFLQDIFQSDDAHEAAIFINHQGEMLVAGAKGGQLFGQAGGIRHEPGRGGQARKLQLLDLVAMTADGAPLPPTLRVDGGMSVNNWCMQFLADILDIPVERPRVTETTALGAAYLAGLGSGFFASPAQISQHWQCDRRFEPAMDPDHRQILYAGWQDAVSRTLTPS